MTPTATTRAGKPVGRVAFVGAGPGDPGLVTLRARDRLAAADIIVTDSQDRQLNRDELLAWFAHDPMRPSSTPATASTAKS